MRRFRIYYEDREPYSGDPFYAPATGALAVALEDPSSNRGYRILRGSDAWYWKPDVGWRECDQMGLWDYLFNFVGPKAVLAGRMTSKEIFDAAVARARKEGLGVQ